MMTASLKVDHLAVLQKFRYRLTGDLTDETRARLTLIISVYERLYG